MLILKVYLQLKIIDFINFVNHFFNTPSDLLPALIGPSLPSIEKSRPTFEELLRSPFLFAAEDEGRTEDPTERRKEKEKEKGRVPKSQEVASTLIVLGAFIVLFFVSGWVMISLGNMMRNYLGNFNNYSIKSIGDVSILMLSVGKETLYMIAPIFAVVVFMAIVGNIMQVGFMFTLKPLEFDFSRIKFDPQTLFKKVLFSRQVGVNLLKTLVKVSLLGLIAYFIIASDYLSLLKTTNMGISDSLKAIGTLAFKLGIILSVVLLVMAIPDYIFQRYEFIESIKMTKEEIKQEYKETEGDPLVKQRQRQRAQELMRRNMLQEVPKADVIITNPTHFAIALRYDMNLEDAPRVLAKGEDHLAFMIRNVAKKNEVPLLENKPLARELYYNVEEGDIVPEQFYRVLVEIFLNLERVKERFAARAG